MPRKTNRKKQCDKILRAYHKHCKAAYSVLKDRLDGGNQIWGKFKEVQSLSLGRKVTVGPRCSICIFVYSIDNNHLIFESCFIL